MASNFNIRQLVYVFCLTLACMCFVGVIAQNANADECDDLVRTSRQLSARIEYIQRRYGDPFRINQQRDALMDDLDGWNAVVANPASTPVELRAAQQGIAGYRDRYAELTRQYRNTLDRSARYREMSETATRRFYELGCNRRPPDDYPPDPPFCYADPANDADSLEPSNDPEVRRLAAQLLQDLLAPDASGATLPVFGRVLPDGSVVDYVTGQPLIPPVPGAPRPLSVGFDEFSPFHAGQAVWVNFYVTRVPGLNQVFASFRDSSGNTLVSTRPAPREVTEIPSVWEVFPNGLFAIELSPAGIGVSAGRAAARPAAEAIGRATGRAQQVLERLQQLLQGLTPLQRSPISDRRRPGSSGGCSAGFNINGYSGVGTNCSGRYGEWTWRVYQGDRQGRGVSVKFVETLRRDGSWAQAKQTQVFYHPFAGAEGSNLTPEAARLQRETAAASIPAIKQEFNGWKARVIKTGRNAGRVQHQAPRTGSRAISTNFRTTPKPGCNVRAPQGYKETSQF